MALREARGGFLRRERNFSKISATLQRERLGLLSGVAGKRFTSGINTQLLGAARAELVLWEDPKHCFAQNLFGPALHQRPDRDFLQTTGKTAMVAIHFLINLVSGEADALRIDYDDVIAAIEVRRVIRLVLANQQARDARGDTAQHQPVGVHHEPILPYHQIFGLSALWNMRRHSPSHTFPSKDKRQV